MNNTYALLKWWLIQCTTVLGALYCFYLGLFHMLWEADASKISFIILALYVGVSGFIGVLTKKAVDDYKQHQRFIETYYSTGWAAAAEMTALGLIGTVIGFMLLLGPTFDGLDLNNAVATQKMLAKMAVGMSTALTTTLVGLVSAVLTRLQMINLDTIIDAQESTELTSQE